MYDRNKQNILDMKEAIEKIFSFTNNISNHEEFHQSQIVFDAVMMNIVVIGEAVSRLTDDFISKNNHIDWIKIKGLRNIIAHDYVGIDVEEIWQIVKNTIPEFNNQINEILSTFK
jgi:uncharacterized protein with HEPN domain